MKKLLVALTLLSGMAHASLNCSGSGYDVSVNGNTLEVSGASNFTSNVTKTVEFKEVYRGSVRQDGVNAVKLVVSFDGSATLELIKISDTIDYALTCIKN